MPFSQKNRLPCRNQSGYISAAPHKTGAGFRSLLTTKAHNRASGFFVRTVLPRLFRTRIMAGRTGPTSVGPGSLVAGTANPVRLATHSFAALDGEFSKLTTKEATPWQTANSTALSRSVVTSRLKSTADFPAHSASRAFRVAKIMHINMLHERSCELSNLYSSAVFSYLADDLRELQQLIQQQNKLH